MSGSKTVRASCYVGVSGVVDDISFAVISFGAAPRAVPLLRAGTIIFKEECIPISRPETARASCNEYIPARVDRDAISNIMTRATPRGIPLQHAGAVILDDECLPTNYRRRIRFAYQKNASVRADRDIGSPVIIRTTPSNV